MPAAMPSRGAKVVRSLYGMITIEQRIEAAPKIRKNLSEFLAKLDPDKDLEPLGLGNLTAEEVVANLTAVYQLNVG
jgi:hypothetical protein